MNVLTARVAFRDRSTIDVFDLALRFLVVHGAAYAKIAAFVALPSAVVATAVGVTWGWGLGWAVAALLFAAGQVPFTLLASRLVFETDVTTKSVLKSALAETPRILVMRVGWLVAMTAGTLLFVIPGLWAAGSLHFMSEVMLLERASVVAAFGRSQRVASASLGESLAGATIGLLVVVAAVVLAELGGRALIADLLELRPPASAWVEGGSALTIAGLFAILPYAATARFFTYLNVRTRVEGWDIQTRFAALAARAETAQ